MAGKPTVFVRTASCNLKCRWCDTQQTPWQGKRMEIDEILTEVKNYQTDYVCITGGEPLAQKGSVVLIDKLLASGYVVSLETNGSFSIKDVPRASIKVIDLKCPDSGESESIAWENFSLVAKQDQFKFVVASKGDFDWALKICEDYKLNEKCTVLFSPVYGQVKPADLAAWILSSHAKATLQLQLHKEIWGPDEKGV